MKIAKNLSVLVLGTSCAVAAVSISGPSAPRDSARSSLAKSNVPSVEEQIFLTVDDKIQTLFADMSLINRDNRGGRKNAKSVGPFFGMSRLPQVSTHTVIMEQLMKYSSAQEFHTTVRSYMKEGFDVGVFGFTGYPKKVGDAPLRLRYADGTSQPYQKWEDLGEKNWDESHQQLWKKWNDDFEALTAKATRFAADAAATIADRPDAAVTQDFGPVTLRAKAIRLDKEECMTCHGDMKLGDPLAIMVYAIQRRERT